MSALSLPELPAVLLDQGVTLRPRRDDDADFMRKLFFSYRQPQLLGIGGSTVDDQVLLEQQYQLQCRHYQQLPDPRVWGVVEMAGQPVGRLYLQQREHSLHLLDLILLPAFQQHGLGSALLRAIQAQAQQQGHAAVSLYVEINNPRAMQLYQRLGFVPMEMQGVHLRMLWSPC